MELHALTLAARSDALLSHYKQSSLVSKLLPCRKMGRSLGTRLLQRECGYETISHHVQYPRAHSPHSYSVEFLANVLPCLTHSLRTKHPHLHGKVGLPPFGKLDSLVGREQAHKTPVDFKNDNPPSHSHSPILLSHPGRPTCGTSGSPRSHWGPQYTQTEDGSAPEQPHPGVVGLALAAGAKHRHKICK